MDWSNEVVLEFIELVEEEPCIWNSKSKYHRNRNIVNDAWARIKSKMTVPCTVEDMKKKRNTLLTQYRDCLKKIKDSMKTASGAEEIYRPSWFAFNAIHNYMGPLYDYRLTISTETRESPDENELLYVDIFEESNTECPLSQESNSQSESDYSPPTKRLCGVQDLLLAKKEMDDESTCNGKENEKGTNECDLYGQLLAQKLKTLDVEDRLILMNVIDNTVFKYVKNARKKNQFNACFKES